MTELTNSVAIDHRPLLQVTDETMARFGVPGAAVGIIHNGEEEIATRGVTSVEDPLPVHGNTLFRIASLTKTTVATAAMRLVEKGRLDLDTPIRPYLPDLRLSDEDVARRVTLRHLLTHTGGWSDALEADPDEPLSQLPDMIAQMPQITPLGEVWSYSNSGVCLAGRVIEVVTQRPFEQAIRELVLDPLQMSRSFFSFGDMITRRVAIGHVVVDNVPRVVARWVDRRWRRPSVGLASSLSDLLRFARFHLSCGTAPDGSRVLSPDSIRLMHSPLTPDRAPARAIGLTWFIDEISGTRTVSLLGSTAGISCQFLMVPERSFAVIALANIAGHAFDREVTAWALGHYLGLAEEIIPLDLPAGVLAGYAGHYVSPYGRLKLDVGDNGLVLHPIESDTGVAVPEGRPPRDREPLRLAFYHQDRVVVLGPRRIGVRGQFLRDSEGRIVWFRYPTVLWGRQP